MAARPGLRLLDLVVAVAAVGVALGGGTGINASSGEDIASIAFWLVFAGAAVVAYFAGRFARTREVRLIVVGTALAFAAAAIEMYKAIHININSPGASAIGAFGLEAVAFVMVLGGVAHGLMIHWHELRHPAPPPAPDGTPPP